MVSDFTGAMIAASATGGLQSVCGFYAPDRVSDLAEDTNDNICGIVSILESIRQYFQCNNFYPVYETVVYDAICYQGMEGFTWVASTQFVVVVMAMVILTYRGAFYDLKIIGSLGHFDVNDPPREVTLASGSPRADDGLELEPSSVY